MRSWHVDGELVSIADRHLIDIGIADIVDAGRRVSIDDVRRRIRSCAGEYVIALICRVGQGHELALNALQLIDDGRPVAVGKRAIGALDAQAEGLLQRRFH